jgi:phosphoribosylamine--glycine ligase
MEMPLKVAMSTYTMYGAWFTLRLLEEGHKVDLYLTEPEYENVLGGIIPSPYVQARGSKGYPKYSKYDLSLFDLTGRERMAEFSATQCPTIGDGAFNCAVEDNRMFGLEAMEECGIKVPPYERFTDVQAAKAYIRKSNKRFVYKPDGGQEQDTDTTYVSSSAEDMLGQIDKLFGKTKNQPFVLQEFVKGTEVSVEGWFNGEEFYLVNVTLEEKKFMNDNKGPNTGCAGNLVFYLREDAELYKQGLEKMKPYLKKIGYCGMIDLNTIVTINGIYGLEWTPRFGYDASATLINMYGGNFGEMMLKIATGQVPDQSWKGEFGASARISIPPYPTEIRGKHPAGVEVLGIGEEDYLSTFMYDVQEVKGSLVTAGHSGFVCCPLAYGNSIGDAWEEVDARLERIKIPNSQYRTDLKKTTTQRYNELSRMGLL